jgi:hypothetical protein
MRLEVCLGIIFTPYSLMDSVVVARNVCYKIVPCKVSIDDRDMLDMDFFKEELFVALGSMQNGKSSSMDGLPCEFFEAMWDTIGDDFYCLIVEMFSSGRHSEFCNQGLIKLISKNAA